ncbi:MAG: hypothetical protein ACI4PC_07015 [Oscillospiraceae bacterium]
MPRNQFQRMIFALLTVVITVHAYVFYSLYVVNGATLMEVTGASGVLEAIRVNGGVYMLGRMCPIWAVVLVEFVLAYCLEIFMGSPCSFKLARRVFDPSRNHPMIFETAIICATVGLMCPAMSFIAAFLYYPYYAGFHLVTLLANWLKLVCFNFPFAFFTQLFFIQPFVRTAFKWLFRKDIQAREQEEREREAMGEVVKPQDHLEAVRDVLMRIEQIHGELEEEYARLKSGK